MFLLALLVFLIGSLVWAVPWTSGETLVYEVLWQSTPVGHQEMTIEGNGETWHYRGEAVPEGVGRVVGGYALRAEGLMGPDFFTRKFHKELVLPRQGVRILDATVAQNLEVRVQSTDGKVRSYSSPTTTVLDDISMLYHVRVNPDVDQVQFVDFPGLVVAPIKHLESRTIETALGKFSARGYSFEGGETKVEVWVSESPERYPVMIRYGSGFSTLIARLIEVKSVTTGTSSAVRN